MYFVFFKAASAVGSKVLDSYFDWWGFFKLDKLFLNALYQYNAENLGLDT